MSDFRAKCTKFDFGWGSALDPAWELIALPQIPELHLRGLLLGEGREGKGTAGNGKGKKGMGEKAVEGSPALLIF